MRERPWLMLIWSVSMVAACGGGADNSDPPVIEIPAPHHPDDNCGISPASGAASTDGVEGQWAGAFPIFSGIDAVHGVGLVTRDGTALFWVGDGAFITGALAATDTGRVNSSLTPYVVDGDKVFAVRDTREQRSTLQFDQVSAHDTLSGMFKAMLSDCEPVDLGYQVAIEQTPSLASLAGVYSNTEVPERSLVLTLDPDGRLSGSYSNGCTLLGTLGIPDPTRNYFSASIDVSSCGDGSGHYDGYAVPASSLASEGTLYLGVRSATTAIFALLPRT